ncbi:GNAT family N-acetyltransferase [Marinicella sediminis]|uniref:GNAT family N-acetyltransferase n=1 Tax=Marinicella sediminis TaxID=1792834 RepID=A0ABV7JDA1_9GAMM|nr:GNAT family N-acetyltransferase [Marinicella sediminis]
MSGSVNQWCQGYVAVALTAFCQQRSWLEKLDQQKPNDLGDFVDQNTENNKGHWHVVMQTLDVLGIIQRNEAGFYQSADLAAAVPLLTDSLSTLYSRDYNQNRLRVQDLKAVAGLVKSLGKTPNGGHEFFTGAILVSLLVILRVRGDELLTTLTKLKAATRQPIVELLRKHQLLEVSAKGMSAWGLKLLQSAEVMQAAYLHSLLADLSGWLKGTSVSTSAETKPQGSNEFQHRHAAVWSPLHDAAARIAVDEMTRCLAESHLKTTEKIVINTSNNTDVALIQTLISGLDGALADGQESRSINCTLFADQLLDNGIDSGLEKALTGWSTAGGLQPEVFGCVDAEDQPEKTKTVHVLGSCGQFYHAVSGNQYSQTVVVQAANNTQRYCNAAGDEFSHADLLSFRQHQLAAWAEKAAGDTLLIFERHSLSPEDIRQRLGMSGCFWPDTTAKLYAMPQISAESLLVLAGSVGLFSDDVVRPYPKQEDHNTFSALMLRKRDYVIRSAQKADMARLIELEKLCWEHSQTPEELILNRLENNPRGQFVLEKSGEVLGVIYSQLINDVADLYQAVADNVHHLHRPDGKVVQLLAVNIDPAQQSFGYGDQLLEFMLQVGTVMTGVNRVVGVTLCKKYDGSVPFDHYVKWQDNRQDPVLAFHRDHGAEVVGAIPGYRPEDEVNLNHGVLVSYDLHSRVRSPAGSSITSAEQAEQADKRAQIAQQDMAEYVKKSICDMLADDSAFDWHRPVMEMGLDSADLMKMQRQLEVFLQSQFSPGLFFEHSTGAKLLDFLVDQGLVQAEDSKPVTDPVAKQQDSNRSADIAIVGMACKLPGGIESPADLWQVLCDEQSQIGHFPVDRCDWPLENDHISRGGFIHGADEFDAEFFRVMPAEAKLMDPQQRLLLQLAWSCLEEAGIQPANWAGSDTGVFIGASNTDYSNLSRHLQAETVAHTASAGALAVTANRISYYFDFSGPSFLVDTACSASLVAVHLACQAMNNGECNAALVGGANLICFPELSTSYDQAGMLSSEGKCKTFDRTADGYVRSEGAVMMLLMPLDQALSGHHPIKSVIKGTAINHGGLAGGLTVPNPVKQAELIATAWKRAGVEPNDIQYIEAHGTGTSLGDPVECQGIQKAITEHFPDITHQETCLLGSVKSNLGHLESAAGITGLLKVVLSQQHQQIPATINFNELNPKINLAGSMLKVATRRTDWKVKAGRSRMAGVSSFGSGGANAHVVLSEWNAPVHPDEETGDQLFILSAKEAGQLSIYAEKMVEWIDSCTDQIEFSSFIYTMQVGRTHWPERLAIVTTGFNDLASQINQWLAGIDTKNCFHGRNEAEHSPNLNTSKSDFQGDVESMDLIRFARQWVRGEMLDFNGLHPHHKDKISAPTYPFRRQSFWIAKTTPQLMPDSEVTSPRGVSYVESWVQFPQDYLCKYEEFSCFSLGFMIEKMVEVAKKCSNDSRINRISGLKFYPLSVVENQQVDCMVHCQPNGQQHKVTIHQKRTSGHQAAIIEATLDSAPDIENNDTSLPFPELQACVDLTSATDLSKFTNTLKIMDLVFPSLLSSNVAEVKISSMFMHEAMEAVEPAYLYMLSNELTFYSADKSPVLSVIK